jgi:hypothetical protein
MIPMDTENDPESQELRNWLLLKLLRFFMFSVDEIVSEKGFANLIGSFYEPLNRQEKIA